MQALQGIRSALQGKHPTQSQPQPQPQSHPQQLDVSQVVSQWKKRLADYQSPLNSRDYQTLLQISKDNRVFAPDREDLIKGLLLNAVLHLPLNQVVDIGNSLGYPQEDIIRYVRVIEQNFGRKILPDVQEPELTPQPTPQPVAPYQEKFQPEFSPPSNSNQESSLAKMEKKDVVADIEPHAQRIEVNPSEPDLSTYKRRGEEMAIAFDELKYSGIKFLSVENGGPRHTRFIFKKPVSLPFSKLQSNINDVLSHAGYSPEETQAIFRMLPNNSFEFQIPRPQDEWQSYSFFAQSDVLSNISIAKQNLKAHMHRLQSVVPKREGLFLRFGVDMDGEPVLLDCTTGAILVGEPNSGKSTAIKALAVAFCMTHTPEQGKILRFDFKDGLTLHLLDGLPHLWKLPGEVNPCPTITSVEEALKVFEALLKEHSNRTKVLKQARLENIYQFNREYPNERIPPIFCLFEEVAGFNAQASRMEGKVAETALKLIHEMVSLFRATGISFLFTTQYPANRCGMTPEIRACLGSGVCFRTTSQAASLVFGDEDSFFTNQVSRLTGMGDSLVKQPGVLKPVHCQGFDLPTEQLKTFVSAMGQLYGSLLDDSLNQLIG